MELRSLNIFNPGHIYRIWAYSEAYAWQFSSVQSLSLVWLFATPWTAACQAFLSIMNSQSLLKLMSIKLVMPFNHLILCWSLLLSSIFPSIEVFSKESVLHIRWPKYCSFSFNIRPSNEYSRLISFRIYWIDLLAVQGTLKSLLQHHSSKASILLRSVFFIDQLSHPHTTTGKAIVLTRRTFVGKVTQLIPLKSKLSSSFPVLSSSSDPFVFVVARTSNRLNGCPIQSPTSCCP